MRGPLALAVHLVSSVCSCVVWLCTVEPAYNSYYTFIADMFHESGIISLPSIYYLFSIVCKRCAVLVCATGVLSLVETTALPRACPLPLQTPHPLAGCAVVLRLWRRSWDLDWGRTCLPRPILSLREDWTQRMKEWVREEVSPLSPGQSHKSSSCCTTLHTRMHVACKMCVSSIHMDVCLAAHTNTQTRTRACV